ncbi:MAG: PH domain-containing protein [Thermoleophilaceae bacterium]
MSGPQEPAGGWQRLHPLSPIVRLGPVAVGLFVILAPGLLLNGGSGESPQQLVILTVIFVGGLISWLVTRWRIDGQELRIETGLVRRSSRRFALSRVQAIDVVRPGLARVFGLAELRLRMGGSTGGHARLAYLTVAEAESLRARLLALAQADQPEPPAAVAEERVLVSVPTARLAGSIFLAAPGLMAEAMLAALVGTTLLAPGAAAGIVGSGSGWLIVIYTLVWRRFNDEYRLTVADSTDGLRVRSGLITLTAETIRPGRIQAVRLTEPLLWRPLGWCRLELDIAGQQDHDREGEAQSRQLRTILPVGKRADAGRLLDHVVPTAPQERLPPPRRAWIKSPMRYRNLAWGHSDDWVVTTSGRVRRVTDWVPLVKAQSLRRVQGPVQRALRLVTIHVDTAGRNVHATLRDRDVAEADGALDALVQLCRAARQAERPA